MNLVDFIGNTPYIPLSRLSSHFHLSSCIYAKLEMMNPLGSIKDRAAHAMIQVAEERKLIHSDSIILEATSGNMGIALSGIASCKGYPCTIIMPENMPKQRQKIISALGSHLILTPANEGMSGAAKAAETLAQSDSRYIYLNQFRNPANIMAHELHTGVELLQNSFGELNCLVLGVGTGATLTGCARFLKKHIPSLKVIAVEPASSAVLSGKNPGMHTIFGIGAGFLPPMLDFSLIDHVISVQDEEAYQMRNLLATTEGIYTGPSSGAALYAAVQAAKSTASHDLHITVLLTDSGERY